MFICDIPMLNQVYSQKLPDHPARSSSDDMEDFKVTKNM